MYVCNVCMYVWMRACVTETWQRGQSQQQNVSTFKMSEALWSVWNYALYMHILQGCQLSRRRLTHFRLIFRSPAFYSNLPHYSILVKLHWWLSKMARADWSRISFSLAIITARWFSIAMTASSFQNGGQICWCFGVANWLIFLKILLFFFYFLE